MPTKTAYRIRLSETDDMLITITHDAAKRRTRVAVQQRTFHNEVWWEVVRYDNRHDINHMHRPGDPRRHPTQRHLPPGNFAADASRLVQQEWRKNLSRWRKHHGL